MSRALPLHGALPEPSGQPRIALAAKGFRPFFLLAASFASAIIPLWLLILRGAVPPNAYLDPTTWHAHEMLFGFVTAVIAGFLLTAVGNWTQRETLVGTPLLALSLLWVLGRLAMLFPQLLMRGLPALVDLAFLPTLTVVLARPLLAAGNRRNFILLVVLTALFTANLVVHLDALTILAAGSARRAILASLDLVLVIVAIIAGRVFPTFTRNATGVTAIRSIVWLDNASVAAIAALALVDASLPASEFIAPLAAVAALLSAARAVHWGARHSVREPLLWILHAGYAWLVLGLALRAGAAATSAVSSALAAHALTVGAIGSLTLGMMARVALGHSGRPLVASRAMAWAFAAMNCAAVARVFLPWIGPAWYVPSLMAAGALWTIAFLSFVWVYAPVLVAPRPDGKAG